ncbi:MaoC family dehydratase N-terminal domain-containing protein [Micromonospora sp. DR5-3]|uniref:FAS1-like dehydratase domain-containing protein n=1 Tax=unclassified Micromonospora TaxID=2617518 RepID=UPI0011D3500C|nr:MULTISPECIES: MaoC family dehydratase N-terminal domain-containing protein [unclassified Micromonospora]MCW3817936.1 MaoC family dehydratase N-terminal domain-containing protein [Micromonospora sp. DR5-3]TYC21392.1 MaoC family dehydratase [Micromonospora sp. MP36]
MKGTPRHLQEPYEVSREVIREFARAVLADDPVHFDVAAARAAGHRDLVAPATFAAALALRFSQPVRRDPGLGLDLTRMVHGGQTSFLHGSLCAGDRLAAETRIAELRAAGRHVRIQTVTSMRAVNGPFEATITHTCLILDAVGDLT